MRPLVRWVFALGCLAAVAAGCGRSGTLDGLGSGLPTPGFPGDGETPVPTATPGLAMPYGDGHDGAFTADGSSINECALLVAGTNGSVTLGSVPASFTIGTVILAWQVQNDFATVADQNDISNPLRAGSWELTRIAGIDGSELAVYPPLADGYVSGGTLRAQACNVPEFTNVTIASGTSIVGVPWANAALGGIVAFFANGTVTLEGTVSVNAMGFRGGAPSAMSGTLNFAADSSTDDMEAGGKGEGLDARGVGLFARGNCSNGGGGGNASRAGGGGGANGGIGGRGGLEKSGDGDTPQSRGLPGARITATTNRLLPGGGGGGGHRLNASNSRGGHGGGVVLMMVKTLTGQGAITADGETPPVAGNDGSGGGGAGGNIDLRVEDGNSFDGDLDAQGGDGADNVQGAGGVRYGPGGGGGGGVIRVLGPLGSVSTDVGGGDNGESSGDSHDAQSGSNGYENVP